MPSGSQTSAVKTIDRAAMLLHLLAEGPSEGSRLSVIAERTGLGKATVHRLLSALVSVGFAQRNESTKLYRLGYRIVLLAARASKFEIIELARPALQRLAAATEDTVFLSIRDGDEAVCVDRVTGAYPIKSLTLNVGDRRPLGVGAGSLALLAFLDDSAIDQVLSTSQAARACYRAFTDEDLRLLIAQARRQGYAFNDGRIVNAMCALGVPVRDDSGRVVAALSIAAIRERMQPPRLPELYGRLAEEARALGDLLGSPGTPGATRAKRKEST